MNNHNLVAKWLLLEKKMNEVRQMPRNKHKLKEELKIFQEYLQLRDYEVDTKPIPLKKGKKL